MVKELLAGNDNVVEKFAVVPWEGLQVAPPDLSTQDQVLPETVLEVNESENVTPVIERVPVLLMGIFTIIFVGMLLSTEISSIDRKLGMSVGVRVGFLVEVGSGVSVTTVGVTVSVCVGLGVMVKVGVNEGKTKPVAVGNGV